MLPINHNIAPIAMVTVKRVTWRRRMSPKTATKPALPKVITRGPRKPGQPIIRARAPKPVSNGPI
jgi:hypothetical protein